MKNPKWQRDEIILALDLYFTLKPGQIHSRNPLIRELSETLNKLSHFQGKFSSENFRNPNGVSMKLSNFLAIDDNYHGKGMRSFSKQDFEIFKEFENEKISLSIISNRIKETLELDHLEDLMTVEDELDEDIAVKEGKIVYKLHKYRERNKNLVKRKKSYHMKKYGNIACEKCNFDFEKVYGALGKDYIECHHITPLSELEVGTETKLEDLKLLCANCHRMEHRKLKIRVLI
ncbi:MAG: HNH endonuclease [Pedobacter sp.]|nr:MAG: HNH endonuclease [Pedobacter sp.]